MFFFLLCFPRAPLVPLGPLALDRRGPRRCRRRCRRGLGGALSSSASSSRRGGGSRARAAPPGVGGRGEAQRRQLQRQEGGLGRDLGRRGDPRRDRRRHGWDCPSSSSASASRSSSSSTGRSSSSIEVCRGAENGGHREGAVKVGGSSSSSSSGDGDGDSAAAASSSSSCPPRATAPSAPGQQGPDPSERRGPGADDRCSSSSLIVPLLSRPSSSSSSRSAAAAAARVLCLLEHRREQARGVGEPGRQPRGQGGQVDDGCCCCSHCRGARGESSLSRSSSSSSSSCSPPLRRRRVSHRQGPLRLLLPEPERVLPRVEGSEQVAHRLQVHGVQRGDPGGQRGREPAGSSSSRRVVCCCCSCCGRSSSPSCSSSSTSSSSSSSCLRRSRRLLHCRRPAHGLDRRAQERGVGRQGRGEVDLACLVGECCFFWRGGGG